MILRATAAALLFAAPAPAANPPPGFQLPDEVRPEAYQLQLRIDPAAETFSGAVQIDVSLARPARLLWLNAKGLAIQEAVIRTGRQNLPARASVVDDEFLALEPATLAPAGKAAIHIRFSGQLDGKALSGAFRRKVQGDWYVFTTFTAIDARRAFPCFDEPRFKTPWKLELEIPARLHAFSNTAAEGEASAGPGWKRVQFRRSAPLPSEVIAFAVGPFDSTPESRAGRERRPVRTLVPQGFASQGAYAASATHTVLARLEEYTGIPYPWDKLDHVALPEGAFGAVENPGLITYLSRSLLIPPDKDTEERRRGLRSLMTHEIAHQWFGNLVTQRTWDDVWLSEGFATWITHRMMDRERPSHSRNLGAVAARERIMEADAGPKTRPVRLRLADRQGLRGVYSPFVYQKAAAILLMIEQWMGEERFQAAVRAYLRRHRHATATTADFAAELAPAARPVLAAFLDRTGIPAVQAEIRCPAGEAPALILRQPAGAGQPPVPVCWRTDQSAACTLLETAEARIRLDACPAWILPNDKAAGYYRSHWPAGGIPPLTALHAAERLNLVFDLRMRTAEHRQLLRSLAADPEPLVADAARRALAQVQ